jgi:hypothetical protein
MKILSVALYGIVVAVFFGGTRNTTFQVDRQFDM